jgi:hypothetical protein
MIGILFHPSLAPRDNALRLSSVSNLDPKSPKGQEIPFGGVVVIIAVILVFLCVSPGHVYVGIRPAQHSQWLLASRSIALLMFQYANDHDQEYPTGKSSTEVFQKLLDGKYASDPMLFYIPLPGKTKPVPGQPLKPENVSWDVSCCLDSSDPDGVPVVFMTGYKVIYAPGTAAIPMIKPYPNFDPLSMSRSWNQWWNGQPAPSPGIAVTYKSNSAQFIPLSASGDIPHFIDSTVNFPPGKKYIQLTPDGPLP